jgi:ribonuclease/clavin/mitogillin
MSAAAASAPPTRVAVAVRSRDSTHLLLRWTQVGVHLGSARDLPTASVTDADVASAARLGLASEVFAAVRLLASFGLRPRNVGDDGQGGAPETHETSAATLRLRAASAASFEAYLREHARATIRVSADLRSTFEGRGDVLDGRTILVAIPVDGDAGSTVIDDSRELEWRDVAAIIAAWADGTELPSPSLALALRASGDAPLRARGLVTNAWEVAPALLMFPLRTPTIPPATHTNAFLVGSGHALLVEPASPYEDEIDRFVAFVEERRAGGLVLDGIVLTHHHPDHVGGAMAMRERLGVPILAHERTKDRLAGRVTIDRTLEDGERIHLDGPEPIDLEFIHTPGHAPGHLCLLERRSGALLAGDMVAGVGTILVEPYDGDMRLYLDSLERLAARGSSMILPAHGGVVRDPRAWLAHYVAHRLAREAKIVAALSALGAPSNLDELVPVAYADTSPMAWPLARMASAAHLDKLVNEGRVARSGDRFELVRSGSGSVM